MSINDYKDPIVSQWHMSNGAKYSKLISNESHIVVGGMFALVGLPDEQNRVVIDGMIEIGLKDKITELNQFKVDYTNGYVFAHSNKEGITINVNYASRGVNMYPASRVWSEINANGDITETLKDVVDAGKTLNDSMTQAEPARVNSENIRKSSELNRATEESKREVAESSRVITEGSRVDSEAIRVTSEQNRATIFTGYEARVSTAEEDLAAHKEDYATKGYFHRGRLTAIDDLNNVLKPGSYYAIDCLNRPTNDIYNVMVNVYDNRYVTQIAIRRSNATQIYIRSRDNNYPDVLTNWEQLKIDGSDLTYKDTKTNEDVNTIIETGLYVYTGTPINKPPELTTIGGLLKVDNYNKESFVIQEYRDAQDTNTLYTRVIRPKLNFYGEWKKKSPDTIVSDPNLHLSGKKMVMFGDSITEFGNMNEIVAQRTGMTVHNCGFGGTRMSRHNDLDYDKFCMTTVAESVANQNFTIMDIAHENLLLKSENFSIPYNLLKSINFNEIDYVSIGYGTNDYSGGITMGAITDIATRDRFNGAIRLVIERLLTAFPHLKIFFITPLFRARQAPGDGLDSDSTPLLSGVYLKDYSNTIIEVAKSRHIPILNFHDDSGFNIYNHHIYSDDGLHPNQTGYNFLGNKIASFVESHF